MIAEPGSYTTPPLLAAGTIGSGTGVCEHHYGRCSSSAITSAASIPSKPESGASPCGSPVRPFQRTRCFARSCGGPQIVGEVGPNRTTEGVPNAVARCATPVSPHSSQSHDLVLIRRPLEAKVRGRLLIEEADRMGKLLRCKDLQRPPDATTGQVRAPLAPTVQNHDAGGVIGSRQISRRSMSDVMGDEANALRVEARKRRCKEHRGPLCVKSSQAFPLVCGDVVGGGRRHRRIVGVRDRVEILRREAGLLETPRRRLPRNLPRGKRHRRLSVLAPGEPLLFRGGRDLAIHHERGSRIVQHSVDAKNAHCGPLLLGFELGLLGFLPWSDDLFVTTLLGAGKCFSMGNFVFFFSAPNPWRSN